MPEQLTQNPLFRLSLAWQFAVASAIVLMIGMGLIGFWVTSRIEGAAVHNAASATALYVDGIIAPLAQELGREERLSDGARHSLEDVLQTGVLSKRLFSFKLWHPDGTVVFSSEPSLIGRKFRLGRGLSAALGGGLFARFDDLHSDENKLEQESRQTLLEIYSPIRETRSGQVIAVAEFYEKADDLRLDLDRTLLQSWLVVGGVAAGMVVLLFGIVARGSHLITVQRLSLDNQVAELSRLLSLNRALRVRADKANHRAAALNEQYLRRISAELHDGPAQLLGFAALRLEAISKGRARDDDALQVKHSISEAIREIRNVCRGLTLPELAPLTGDEVARRAIKAHQIHARTKVIATIGPMETPSHAVKICIYRFLQETLSNAARHANASEVRVAAGETGGRIELCVRDDGDGFFDPPGEFGLGLAGLRERVTGLGGEFDLLTDGTGTRVTMTIAAGVASEDA